MASPTSGTATSRETPSPPPNNDHGSVPRRRRSLSSRVLGERVPGDLVFMGIKSICAAALLGTAFFLTTVPERPIYGNLEGDVTPVRTAKRVGFLLAVVAGTLLGVLARKLRSRPLYGLYYILNVFAIGLCLLAAVWPNMLSTSSQSFCAVAWEECKHVPNLDSCPYTTTTVTMATSSFTAGKLFALSFLMNQDEKTGTTMLRQKISTPLVDTLPGLPRSLAELGQSECCYLDDFEKACGRLFGAAWLLTVLSSVLACVVLAQSILACNVLCWNTDDFMAPRLLTTTAEPEPEPSSSSSTWKGDKAVPANQTSPLKQLSISPQRRHPLASQQEIGQDEKAEVEHKENRADDLESGRH